MSHQNPDQNPNGPQYQPQGPQPQYGYAPGGPSGPAAPPKKRKKWPWILGGIVLLLFVIGQCSGPGVEENTERVQEQMESQPTREPEPTPEPTREVVEDVAEEIPADTGDEMDFEAMDPEVRQMIMLTAIRSEGGPVLSAMSDEQIVTAAEAVCTHYDQADPTDNTMLNLALVQLSGTPAIPGVTGSDESAVLALGELAGFGVLGMCPEHGDDMQAEAVELQNMG